MEMKYDKVADALSIRLSGGKVEDSEELKPGIILDYGKKRGSSWDRSVEFLSS